MQQKMTMKNNPTWKLFFSDRAKADLTELEKNKSKKATLNQVRKILGFMEINLKHPSLQTHKFDGMSSKLGDVFESYVQNHTSGAYRIFWAYGPNKGELFILSIVPHK